MRGRPIHLPLANRRGRHKAMAWPKITNKSRLWKNDSLPRNDYRRQNMPRGIVLKAPKANRTVQLHIIPRSKVQSLRWQPLPQLRQKNLELLKRRQLKKMWMNLTFMTKNFWCQKYIWIQVNGKMNDHFLLNFDTENVILARIN